MNFSQRRTRLLCQNLGGDLFDDSPDVVSPSDEMKKVMLDLSNADDVSLACVSVAEASVSTPEDVCNRIKKNLTGFEKDTFLPLHVVRQRTLSAYADDTQIFFADSTAEKVEEVINADLGNVDKWYEQNGMKRNTSKYQAIVMVKSQVKPQFYCENTAIPITGELEMLGVAVDDKMKSERHIANVCRKVSQQIAVLKRMKKILPFETRKCLYLGFIIPHFNYCSETWH